MKHNTEATKGEGEEAEASKIKRKQDYDDFMPIEQNRNRRTATPRERPLI